MEPCHLQGPEFPAAIHPVAQSANPWLHFCMAVMTDSDTSDFGICMQSLVEMIAYVHEHLMQAGCPRPDLDCQAGCSHGVKTTLNRYGDALSEHFVFGNITLLECSPGWSSLIA